MTEEVTQQPTQPLDINPAIPPSGTGCVECMASDGWWMKLRRCASCGHVGCCNSSPSQHASAHAHATGHSVAQSFEPNEDWFWDYTADAYVVGPELVGPNHHPLDQPTPGPAGLVPDNWEELLHKQ